MWTQKLKKTAAVSIATLLLICAAELGLRFAAEWHLHEIRQNQNSQKPREGALKLLFLGESTTAWGQANSYPAVLGSILSKKFPQATFEIINEGVPATDTGKILSHLDETIEKFHPDIVFTMMGINDFWAIAEKPESSAVQFLKNLRIYKVATQIRARIWLEEKQSSANLPQVPVPKQYPNSDEAMNQNEHAIFLAAQAALKESRFQEGYRLLDPLLSRASHTPAPLLFLGGKLALRLGKDELALRLLTRAVNQSKNPSAFFDVVNEYIIHFGMSHPTYQRVIRSFSERALEIDPDHALSNWAMGCLIKQSKQGEEEKGIAHLRRAENAGMRQGDLYTCLAGLQERLGDISGAIDTLNRGKNLEDINRVYIYTKLIELYEKTKRQELAQKTLAEAKSALPGNALLNSAQSRKYGYANFLESPITRRNYRSIVEKLLGRKIKVLAVQYPVISALPLEAILKGLPVSVVSNQENFQAALKQMPFDSLFLDHFAGQFGHFSPLGASLAAESILQRLEELHYLGVPLENGNQNPAHQSGKTGRGSKY